MELHAYTRTISDLFSVKKKYVVPRFQREYSWTKEQVGELWDDVASNIHLANSNNFNNVDYEEYFIGALVLVGDDKSASLQIVDGQQRLTTITILLSVLCDRFLEIERENLAHSIHDNYIAGKDDEGNSYFKLENETPKPFFQKRIQHISKDKIIPSSDEEKTLLAAYDDIYKLTARDALAKRLGFNGKVSDKNYEALLKCVRDQVAKYLKVIFITVKEEEEAYTIFETLNARGMNLSFVDLIKNKLFKELNDTHPDDDAKTKWKNIRNILSSRDDVGSLETFVRHWWISKFSYVSADKVYKEFKGLWRSGKIAPVDFIEELHSDANTYVKISSPIVEDYREQESKSIFNALSAFKVFRITLPRPFLISLFKAKERRVIRHQDLKRILSFMESFHFMFNAVCSLRPSGVEGSYSKAARDLQLASNRIEAKSVIDTLKSRLIDRVPEQGLFVEKFNNLRFHNGYTKDKKLIQYILVNIEKKKLGTDELAPQNLSLEHILSQSSGSKDVIGKIGNLLPLSQELNVEADNKAIQDKLAIYEKSKYALTNEFAEEYLGRWDATLIDERTSSLAKLCYNSVWTITS